MRLCLFVLTLFVSTLTLGQRHKDHGEIPDFINKNFKIHYVSKNSSHSTYFKLQLRKIVTGEITVQSAVDAFAESNFELDEDEYLVYSETIVCTQNGKREYRFTFYDPKIKRQWSFNIQEFEEVRALYKYRQHLNNVPGDPSDMPTSRTGSETINEYVKLLLSTKDKSDQELFVYLTENDYLLDSSVHIGEFVSHYKNKITYTTITGEEKDLNFDDFYRCKINGIFFIPISSQNYYTMVTPIGFREKHFYIDAGTILNIIETSEAAYYFGTVPSENYVHYVSDSETSEIYKFHDLEEDNSGEWQLIFECITEIKSEDRQKLIDREIECVQQFLSAGK